MSNDNRPKQHVLEQRVANDGMNVSPPAPTNIRPKAPPPAPPKAPKK